jgi:hypothetical protein
MSFVFVAESLLTTAQNSTKYRQTREMHIETRSQRARQRLRVVTEMLEMLKVMVKVNWVEMDSLLRRKLG